MGPTHYNLVILIILMGVLITPKVIVSAHFGYNVTVTNGLQQGEQLVFRCQSKDTDLGYHHFSDTGASFSWVFKVNFLETTLYFCHFYWRDKTVSFPVFTVKNEGDCAYLVYWEVRSDGFYYHCDDDDSYYKHSWSN
ncbi:S-protein homolog 29-like [Amaranthus tricolor]|uniref:S-protein homolog 29-like n=1 Tax=Amaranthus tricolor TaxID=29722 RepID=UPI0025853662|nr:S-protein homolog 29-like [Amaranthus tricolor]